MNFNPIFFQPLNNIQGVSDSAKLQKLTANSYLFADIIKVCIEQDASLNAISGNNDISGIKFNGLNTSDILNLKNSNPAQPEIGNEYKMDFSKLINLIKEVPEINQKSSIESASFFFNNKSIETLSPEITSDLTKNEVLNFLTQALAGLKNQASIVNLQSAAGVSANPFLINKEVFSLIYDSAENSLTISKPLLNDSLPVLKVSDLFKGNKKLKSDSTSDELKSDSDAVYQVMPDSSVSVTGQEDYLKNVIIAALQNRIPVNLNMPQNDGSQLEIEITQPDIYNTGVNSLDESLPGNANTRANKLPVYLTFVEILQSTQNSNDSSTLIDKQVLNTSETINSAPGIQPEKNTAPATIIQTSNEIEFLRQTSQSGKNTSEIEIGNPLIKDKETNYFMPQKPGEIDSITRNDSEVIVTKGNAAESANEKTSGIISNGEEEKNVSQDAANNGKGAIKTDIPQNTEVKSPYSSLVEVPVSKKTQTQPLEIKNSEQKAPLPENKNLSPETNKNTIVSETRTVTRKNNTTATLNSKIIEKTNQASANSNSEAAIGNNNNDATVSQEENNQLLFSVKIKTKNSAWANQEFSKTISDNVKSGLIYKRAVSVSSPIIKASQGSDITIDFSYMLDNASEISGDFISDSSLKRMIINNKTAQSDITSNQVTVSDKTIPVLETPVEESNLNIYNETKTNIIQKTNNAEIPYSFLQPELSSTKNSTDTDTNLPVPSAGRLSTDQINKNRNDGLQDFVINNGTLPAFNASENHELKNDSVPKVSESNKIVINPKPESETENVVINNSAFQTGKISAVKSENEASRKLSESSNEDVILSGKFAANKIDFKVKPGAGEKKNAEIKPNVYNDFNVTDKLPKDNKIILNSSETSNSTESGNKQLIENENTKTEPKISTDNKQLFNEYTSVDKSTFTKENILNTAVKQADNVTGFRKEINPGAVIDSAFETIVDGKMTVKQNSETSAVESANVKPTDTAVKIDENTVRNNNNNVFVEENNGFVEKNSAPQVNSYQFRKTDQLHPDRMQNQAKTVSLNNMQTQEQPAVTVASEVIVEQVKKSLKTDSSVADSKTNARENKAVNTEIKGVDNSAKNELPKAYIEVEVEAGSNTIIKINTTDKKTGMNLNVSELKDKTGVGQFRPAAEITIEDQRLTGANVNEKTEDISGYKSILNKAVNNDSVHIAGETSPTIKYENEKLKGANIPAEMENAFISKTTEEYVNAKITPDDNNKSTGNNVSAKAESNINPNAGELDLNRPAENIYVTKTNNHSDKSGLNAKTGIDDEKSFKSIIKDDSAKVNTRETIPDIKTGNTNNQFKQYDFKNINTINKETEINKNLNDDNRNPLFGRNDEINVQDNKNTRPLQATPKNENGFIDERKIVSEQKPQKNEMLNEVKETLNSATHRSRENIVSETSLNTKKEKEEKSASISEDKNIKSQEIKLENIKSEKEFNNTNGDRSRRDNQEAINTGNKNVHPDKKDAGNSFNIELKPIENSTVNKTKLQFENPSTFENNYKTVKAPDVMREISDFISKGDTKSIVLKIDPENLGKVKIVLDMTDKLVNAHIEVENQNVKNAVMNNIDNLRASLAQTGVELNSVNVSLPGYEQKNPKQTQPRKKQSAGLGNDEVEEAKLQGTKSWGYNTYEYII